MVAPTTVATNNNENTVSIPSIEVVKQAVTTCDTRFSSFLATEYGRLDGLLQSHAEQLAGHPLEWRDGEWDKRTPWLQLGDKRDKRNYKAFYYTDSRNRPRRRLRIWDRRANAVEVTFDDGAVIDDEYEAWKIDVLRAAGRLTPAERQRFEAERAARRAQAEQQHLEWKRKRAEAAEQRRIEAEREAAERADYIRKAIERWLELPTTGSSAYITRKGLVGRDWSDVRHDGPSIEIALRDPLTGNPTGIQRVNADGSKKQIWGSVKQGSCVFVTGIPAASTKNIVLTEGWASGASIAVALDDEKPKHHVVAAIDAGNLEAVYRALKKRYSSACITIAADDDRWKALEIDAKGKRKPNTGQEKAHTLAMWAGARVATPDFSGLNTDDKPTDFNDLHALGGLERVREQVLAARRPNPMFAYNDVATAALRRGIGLAKHYGCTYEVDPGRLVDGRTNLSYRDFREGVTLVRAPMGSGKTEMVSEWSERHSGETFMAVTYLRGLTLDLARRFNAMPYVDLRAELTDLAPHSAWCLNSVWRLFRNGRVRPVDTLFIDEVEPLLKRLTSRQKFEHKKLCIEVLEYLVRSAKRVILADANLDKVTLRWIKRLRPQDAPHIILSPLRPGVGRTFVQYEQRGDVRAFARDALVAGRHVYYAVNGLRKAKEIHHWVKSLEAELPDLRTLLICSDTTNETEVQAFFADPNVESAKYDLIVASPSVSTGVSVTNGHFDYVCGELTAIVSTPKDGVQMLARVRGVAETHLWVDPQRRSNPTDRNLVRSTIWRNPGIDAEMGKLQLSGEMRLEADYEALYLDVTTTDNKAANRYAQGVWRLVREDGFAVNYGVTADDAVSIERHGKETAETVRREKLEVEIDVTTEQAQKLEQQDRYGQLDQAGKARLERHRIKASQCLPEQPSTDEMRAAIELDDDGKLRRQLAHLEIARADEDALIAKMTELVEAGVLPPDITRRDHWQPAFRATLKAAGIDPDTLEHSGERYDEDDIRERWIKPLESVWAQFEVTVLGWPALKYAQAQPTKALGGALRAMFGITHRIKGKKEAAKYTVDAEPLELRRELIERRMAKGGDVAVSNNPPQHLPPANISPLESEAPTHRETTAPVSILPTDAELPFMDDPEVFLRATIGWIGNLTERPTPELVYEAAVPMLAMTFREEVQGEQYEKYRSRLLDDTSLEDATPDQLRAAALGYYGWARERLQNGARNRGPWAWLEAAQRVLAGYSEGSRRRAA